MPNPVIFEGHEYVDASIEYFRLPPRIRIESDRWNKRLESIGLKMILPNVRSCKFGDIRTLETRGVKKSIYVLKSCWDRAVRDTLRTSNADSSSAPDDNRGHRSGNQESPTPPNNDAADEQGASSSSGAGENAQPNHPEEQETSEPIQASRIKLEENEIFFFNGQPMQIDIYGERAFDKMMLSAQHVVSCIGFQASDMPDIVTKSITTLTVDGSRVEALPLCAFLHLAYLKKGKYPVAKEIADWITQTVFSVQYEGGRNATQQKFFVDRDIDYKSVHYGINGHVRAGIYVENICSAEHAAKFFPTQVADALPPGADIKDYDLYTCGESQDFKQRTYRHRSDFKKLFPGCDVRPISFADMPKSTEPERREAEKNAFTHEFAHQRVDIPGQRELFLFDEKTRQQVCVDMQLEACNYIVHKVEAVERLSSQDKERSLIEQRLIIERDNAREKLESNREQLESALLQLNELKNENKNLKESVSKLLPRKMQSVFRGVFNSGE